jgi:hypothetical protein
MTRRRVLLLVTVATVIMATGFSAWLILPPRYAPLTQETFERIRDGRLSRPQIRELLGPAKETIRKVFGFATIGRSSSTLRQTAPLREWRGPICHQSRSCRGFAAGSACSAGRKTPRVLPRPPTRRSLRLAKGRTVRLPFPVPANRERCGGSGKTADGRRGAADYAASVYTVPSQVNSPRG